MKPINLRSLLIVEKEREPAREIEIRKEREKVQNSERAKK